MEDGAKEVVINGMSIIKRILGERDSGQPIRRRYGTYLNGGEDVKPGWRVYGVYGTRRTAEAVADKIRAQHGHQTHITEDRQGNHSVLVKEAALTDRDSMPFGKFKGKAMGEVPASYLDWLHGQPWLKDWPKVLAYIEENRTVLDKELEDRSREA